MGNVEVERMTLPPGLLYGAIVTSVRAPDRDGAVDNVVLGYPAADACCTNPEYQPAFPGTVLRPGESYHSTPSWRLSVV